MNQTKIALVTGASSGIGRAVSEALLQEGYEVDGIGRNFPDDTAPGVHRLAYDLRDVAGLPAYLKAGLPGKLSLLANCAGVAFFGPHETLSPAEIHEMVTVNTEVPILLSGLFLRDLKETGISSITAKQSDNTHGCAYGATKAALTNFSLSLFAEIRKSGVRVITIHPDLTDTALYRNADFRPAEDPDCVLSPEEVAEAALFALKVREGMAVNDITLRPQRNRIVRKTDA